MCQVELVEVVNVRDAEVEGSDEESACWGEVGEEVEGDEEGAEDEFFGYWALGSC